jgi:hypothetical protein
VSTVVNATAAYILSSRSISSLLALKKKRPGGDKQASREIPPPAGDDATEGGARLLPGARDDRSTIQLAGQQLALAVPCRPAGRCNSTYTVPPAPYGSLHFVGP